MVQRIKFNLDQKLTVFSLNPGLMINYTLSFFISIIAFNFLAVNTVTADHSLFTDSIPPAPTLNAGSLNVGGPFTVGIGFSEEVFGLTADDFSVENGEVGEVTGENMNYSVLIDPIAVGVVRFKVPAGVVVDEAGNGNVASGTLSVNFTDEEEPLVFLSTPQNTVDSIFPVLVEFNEPVTGLEVSDFNISNGAGVNLTGIDTTYTLMVNPGAVGAVSIFLPAAAVVDTAGNPNLVSNFLQVNFGTIDVTAPEVILSTSTTEVSEPFIVEIRFSEEITGLSLSDFLVTNAELSNLSGVDNVFTLLGTPILEGEITIQLEAETIVDLFDNPNEASNELVLNYLVPLAPDTIRPAIILEELATGVEGTYQVKIEFSELVTDLAEVDLVFNNAVVSTFTQNDQTYNVELVALDFGTVEFSIGENVVTDAAGNGNIASEILFWEFLDNTPPVEPEEILDITLNRVNNAVLVDWFTNTEVANAYFEVRHSGDGINYTVLEETNSANNQSGLFSYNFLHETPVFGINYYYVRQYDQNGNFVDSEISTFDFMNLFPDALVYPNPASNQVTFNTTKYAGVRCEIMVYNSLGQIFLLDVYEALPNFPIELDISDYQEGVYGVQFWIKETARVADSFVIVR